MKPLLTLLFLLLSLLPLFAQTSGWVSINLNATEVWWNDSMKAYGEVYYSNGTPINGTVELEVNGEKIQCPDAMNGKWECEFYAPIEIGRYVVGVNLTDPAGNSFINFTTFKVMPYYGEIPMGSVERIVYEVPMLLQDVSGEVRKVTVRIMVWRG